MQSPTKRRKVAKTPTKESEPSKTYFGWKRNIKGSRMRKKITERLTGGRKWISRLAEVAKEVLRQGWEQHKEPKPEQRIKKTTRGLARRTTLKDPSRRDPQGEGKRPRSTKGGAQSEESTVPPRHTQQCVGVFPRGRTGRDERTPTEEEGTNDDKNGEGEVKFGVEETPYTAQRDGTRRRQEHLAEGAKAYTERN